MSYTIQSATYSNPGHTAAILQTAEAGAVFASAERPTVWQAFQTWIAGGGVPQPYAPPDPTTFRDEQRQRAKDLLQTSVDGSSKLYRAIALAAVKSDNVLRSWLRDFKTQVAQSSSLADFKNRVATLPNLPDLDLAAIRAAVLAEIDAGAVD